jgi:hypothetical protein
VTELEEAFPEIKGEAGESTVLDDPLAQAVMLVASRRGGEGGRVGCKKRKPKVRPFGFSLLV